NDDGVYCVVLFLPRAVLCGRALVFPEPFFFKLVDVVAKTMGNVFPEILTQQSKVKETIHREEQAFNKTLDEGIHIFDAAMVFNAEKAKTGLPVERTISGEFAFKL